MFRISNTILEPRSLSLELINSSAGALATFEGWVRNHNDGNAVTSLEYECFETMAEKEGTKIIEEAKAKFGILDASCSHRVGQLPVGELAVWVGVSSVHRAEAFDACRYVIDEIKMRLPIWKKEHYVNGTTSWVNCSAHEHARTRTAAEHSHASVETRPKESTETESEMTESQYYARQTAAKEIGTHGQKKLKNSSILIIGAGGTGCPALQYLAGAGVGKIGICDFDVVSTSNLHRQPLYVALDIGKNKAEVAANRLRAANPFINVTAIAERFEQSNAVRLLADYELVLDCTDNLAAKFCIADASRESAKILLQASVHGFDGQLMLWRPTQKSSSDSESTEPIHSIHSADTIDPIDAHDSGALDYVGQCYRCLWPSAESLQENGRDCVDSCSESGILGAVPGVLGVMQAIEAIKLLLGLPSPLAQHVVLFDLISCTTTKVKVRRSKLCPYCGTADDSGHSESTAAIKDRDAAAEEDTHEFELHWSVLQSRSPRELVYVDIRSKKESESDRNTQGKLKGRTVSNLPLEELDIDLLTLDRNLTYLFFCQRGRRSNSLVHKLRTRGHRNVFSLSQGVQSFSPQNNEHAKV